MTLKMRSRSGGFENEIKVRWLRKWYQGQVVLKMRSRSGSFENEIKVGWLWKWYQGQVICKTACLIKYSRLWMFGSWEGELITHKN